MVKNILLFSEASERSGAFSCIDQKRLENEIEILGEIKKIVYLVTIASEQPGAFYFLQVIMTRFYFVAGS